MFLHSMILMYPLYLYFFMQPLHDYPIVQGEVIEVIYVKSMIKETIIPHILHII